VLSTVETWPFVIATLLLLLIAVTEGLALLLGGSLFHWVGHVVPHGAHHSTGLFEKGFGWLHVGRVPLLVILVTFLAAFAMIGFALNMATHHALDLWVPVWLSTPLAATGALPCVRVVAAGVARVVPQDQSFAVTLDSLIGRVATVLGGQARKGYPAQAKVLSEHGQTLYVMVEPEGDATVFDAGASVLLVRQLSGKRFAGIVNPRPDLL
jgi:hypothetical protein